MKHYRIEPGEKVDLSMHDPDKTGDFQGGKEKDLLVGSKIRS